jgi:hypothetical protein
MPVIPISCVEALPTSIQAFHRQLLASVCPKRQPGAALDLLPHCSVAHPLPEHAVNVLSDITKDLKDLLLKAMTTEGQQFLRDYLGDDAERLINFWQHDHPVQ